MRAVHQLKATIIGTKPPVWRRLLVASDSTLTELHEVLQAAFGWFGMHLHEFEIGGRRYSDDDDDEELGPDKGSNPPVLGRLVRDGDWFTYTYDFGDDWRHRIVVEKVIDADPTAAYPVCIAGRRACPPEDCGGPAGYAHFLQAIADPNDPEHAELLEWVGGSFDADEFDVNEVAARLASGPMLDW